jgi:hypothetical protein
VLTAAGSPLVGGASPGAMNKTARVKVLRPFLLKTQRKEIGAEFELDYRLAVELAAYNKVELLHSEAAKVAPEPAAEAKPERAKKGA